MFTTKPIHKFCIDTTKSIHSVSSAQNPYILYHQHKTHIFFIDTTKPLHSLSSPRNLVSFVCPIRLKVNVSEDSGPPRCDVISLGECFGTLGGIRLLHLQRSIISRTCSPRRMDCIPLECAGCTIIRCVGILASCDTESHPRTHESSLFKTTNNKVS
jgi:hypothetical protein